MDVIQAVQIFINVKVENALQMVIHCNVKHSQM